MPKFFVKKEQIQDDIINIVGTDVNHIKNVLRLKVQEELIISCEENNYLCQIIDMEKEKITCKILSVLDKKTEPNVYIHIIQGLPKSDKMEWIIEKCTEVGVSEFTPIETKRSIVKLDEKGKDKKLIRWQKIAEVAAKQSGRDIVPKVNNIINIEKVYQFIKNYDIILTAYEKETDYSLKQAMQIEKYANLKVAVLVGPEGGWDENEIEYLKSLGINTITLGKRILRTETAPIVIASNIIYELD